MNESQAPSESESSFDKLPSPAAAIAVETLLAIARSEAQPLRLRQLAKDLGVPRSTLHRVLQTMEALGVVERADLGYVLGERASQLGLRLGFEAMAHVTAPILGELHRRVRETVNLGVPQEGGMLIIATLGSSEPLRLVSWVGRLDLYHASALGKAYLAALNPEQLARTLHKIKLTAATPRTLTTRGGLLKDLDITRARGYALDDQESVSGVRCVAVVISNRGGKPAGAVSVSAPATRLAPNQISTIAELVTNTASRISALLINDPVRSD